MSKALSKSGILFPETIIKKRPSIITKRIIVFMLITRDMKNKRKDKPHMLKTVSCVNVSYLVDYDLPENKKRHFKRHNREYVKYYYDPISKVYKYRKDSHTNYY